MRNTSLLSAWNPTFWREVPVLRWSAMTQTIHLVGTRTQTSPRREQDFSSQAALELLLFQQVVL